MKAIELMLNDIVKVMDTKCKVSELVNSYIKFHDLEYDAPLHFNTDALEDYIQGIPLNEEILTLNGFNDECYHILIYNGITIEICLDGSVPMYIRGDIWTYSLPHPYYVHELQHLLRACGFNDLANNLKIA